MPYIYCWLKSLDLDGHTDSTPIFKEIEDRMQARGILSSSSHGQLYAATWGRRVLRRHGFPHVIVLKDVVEDDTLDRVYRTGMAFEPSGKWTSVLTVSDYSLWLMFQSEMDAVRFRLLL